MDFSKERLSLIPEVPLVYNISLHHFSDLQLCLLHLKIPLLPSMIDMLSIASLLFFGGWQRGISFRSLGEIFGVGRSVFKIITMFCALSIVSCKHFLNDPVMNTNWYGWWIILNFFFFLIYFCIILWID